MLRDTRGFTLVEMVVVMAVFIVIIMISGDTFNTILQQSSRLFRSEESNIEGVVGLEMLRHDLQQAGYGLFTETSPATYLEAAAAPANLFNEACLPPVNSCGNENTSPPRPFVFGENLAAAAETSSGATYNVLAASDYLAIKGMSVARSRTSQKWTYLKYVAGTGGVPNTWPSESENFSANNRVVLLNRNISATKNTLSIVPDGSDFYFAYSQIAFEKYSSSSSNYIMYGLNDSGTPIAPFNRSDYFVARPADTTQIPAVCASGTGILYKTIMNQTDGKLTYYPVLDCVADMQIVLGWDLSGSDGLVDTWSNANGTQASGPGNVVAALLDPVIIKSSLKVVKIFILAQNGRKDTGYTSPSPINLWELPETPSTLGKTYTLAADQLNYRWKVYRIVVRPKNLAANQ